jgi:hypothetical protein
MRLVGEWTGKNSLWLMPEEPARESETQALLSLAGQGKYLILRYTWVYEDQPQDGMVLMGFNKGGQVNGAVWLDSWHLDDQMMLCQGVSNPESHISLTGSYPAPPGPDWGWWIELQPGEDEELKLVMHNVTPEGQAHLAVEAIYNRAARI